jgi:hypothetical protein
LALRKFQCLGYDPGSFQCSNRFIHKSTMCDQFSSQRFHMRHRALIGGCLDIDEWTRRTKELLATVQSHRITNNDETAWRVVPNGLLTRVPIRKDSVSVFVNMNGKDAITVLASVTTNFHSSSSRMEILKATKRVILYRGGRQRRRSPLTSRG